MAVIGALIYKIQADIADLVKNTETANVHLSRLTEGVGSLSGMLGKLGGAAALGMAVKSTAEWADNLDESAQALSMNVTALQELNYAAAQNGADSESMYKALATLSEKLATGDKSFVEGLRKAGLEIDTLRGKQLDQAFGDVARAIRDSVPEAERFAVAADILNDKLSKRLMTTLVSDLEAAREAAPKMSAETVAAVGKANDSFGALINSGKVLIGSVLGPLVPMFDGIASGASKAAAGISEMVSEFDAAIKARIDGASTEEALAGALYGDRKGPAKTPPSPLKAGAPLPALKLPTEDDQKQLEEHAKQALAFAEAEVGAVQLGISDMIEGLRTINGLTLEHAKIMRDQETRELERQLMITNQIVSAQLDMRAAKQNAFARLGLDNEGNPLPPAGQALELYKLDQARQSELDQADAQRQAARHPVTGEISPAAEKEYQDLRAAINRHYDDEIQKVYERFLNLGAAADRAAGALDRIGGGASRPGGSSSGSSGASAGRGWEQAGGVGPDVSRPNGLTGWDLSVYNASVNSALFGKGNSAEMNRIIYGPTVFPGQTPVSGGGAGVTINQMTVDASRSFFDTPQSLDGLADKVAGALESRMRSRGYSLS